MPLSVANTAAMNTAVDRTGSHRQNMAVFQSQRLDLAPFSRSQSRKMLSNNFLLELFDTEIPRVEFFITYARICYMIR